MCERLEKSQSIIFKYAKAKADTERIYRMLLAQEIIRLKAEGYQAALIPDLARGGLEQEKFKRDLADGHFKATIESMQAIKVQISALQSIIKYQADI